MTDIQIKKATETIFFGDKADPECPKVVISLDDETINNITQQCQLTIKEAPKLPKVTDEMTQEERDTASEEIARFQKRMLTAIIGADGYQTVIDLIADGKEIDPKNYNYAIGDVLAAVILRSRSFMPGNFMREMNKLFPNVAETALKAKKAPKKRGKSKK